MVAVIKLALVGLARFLVSAWEHSLESVRLEESAWEHQLGSIRLRAPAGEHLLLRGIVESHPVFLLAKFN